MKSVLITGANRGLGLGMVKFLTKNTKVENIFATCRNVSEELKNISETNKNVHILHLEAADVASFDNLFPQISKVTGDQGLNLLINNAGTSTKFTKLNLVKPEQLLSNLTINTIAPIILTKSLLPLLKQAAQNNSDKPVGVGRAAVINMSSVLGSIAQNDVGGFYAYRCSKAALNAATKSMSIDLKKDHILVASMHPGWVRTDMGGKKAPLDVDTSVAGMFSTIQKLTEADSGKFLQYDGSELPW
ncbi:short-chain dehydrogenase [Danaus plexippus plexippus]|uniref:Short-chain dehydrogenase n=1 Tax=Danaus plexippus plexippus TaxID=278856 RepID=A0A212EHL5_DANPL|nr:short-chain dehydrogenase [Danaus plexippus plexippus]